MSWISWPRKIVGTALLIALMGLALALAPAAFMDRGPTGNVRVSLFPFALILLDPYVWTCVWNSVLIAGLVSFGSLVLGVGIGTAGSTWTFRGRGILWGLTLVPMACGPLLIAPAVRLALGEQQSMDWLSARTLLGFSLDDLVRWLALLWVELAVGVPLVAIASAASLRKLEPTWIDAATITGASPLKIWRDIVWPFLKPTVAEASGAVFLFALIEPAGPVILGLNRTLTIAIIDSSTRLEQPTRAAGLALLSVGIVAIAKTLIGWWGGPLLSAPALVATPRVEQASFRRATICRLILLSCVIFGTGPLSFLLLRAFQALQTAAQGMTFSSALIWAEDPEVLSWVSNSATTASLALLIDMLALRLLLTQRPVGARSPVDLGSNLLRGLPPLALGVGALATPWLLFAGADLVGGILRDGIRNFTSELNPARSPGFLLILVVAAGKFPMLSRLADLSRNQVRPTLVDASKLMGLSDRRAIREGQRSWLGFVPLRPALLVFALAATNLAPALLMTPFSERRTIAPAIVVSVAREGRLDVRIAAAIILVFVGKVTAFAVASKSRVGSLGDWYRG